VGADLHAGKPQLADTALELAYRERGILHRNRPESDEAPGMPRDDAGDVIVEDPGQVEPVRGTRPVAEHHGHRREHLHRDVIAVAFAEPAPGIPAVVGDFAEGLVVDDHARATGREMVERHEASIPVALPQVGPALREDVGMEVDPERVAHAVIWARGPRGWTSRDRNAGTSGALRWRRRSQ
jgi:hypothetical protein